MVVEGLECAVAVGLVAWGCRGLAGGFVKRGGGGGGGDVGEIYRPRRRSPGG